MVKNKKIFFVNIFFILAILVVIALRFYKKEIEFNCDYDSNAAQLSNVIKQEFNNITIKEVFVAFIFNQLPSKSDIDTIQKLYSKFGEKITVLAIFHKRFTFDQGMKFPYKFLTHLKLSCRQKPELSESNYYLILKDNRIKYIESNRIELVDLAFLVQKRINPQLGYTDFFIAPGDFREKIIQRLKKGNLSLMRLSANREEILKDVSGISKVYFIHASCSSCQLKSLFANLRLNQIVDDKEKVAVIFSIFADRFSLEKEAEKVDLRLPIYLDIHDEFGLFSTITDDRQNPLIIDLNEEKVKNEK